MADVRVRNLEDWIVDTLKLRAKSHGRSLEAELRRVLADSVLHPRRKMIEDFRALREEIRKKYGILPDSTPYIRAMRDGEEE